MSIINNRGIRLEKHAEQITGLSRKQLHKASEENKSLWKQNHSGYISQFLTKAVTGWYPSEKPASELLEKSLKI